MRPAGATRGRIMIDDLIYINAMSKIMLNG